MLTQSCGRLYEAAPHFRKGVTSVTINPELAFLVVFLVVLIVATMIIGNVLAGGLVAVALAFGVWFVMGGATHLPPVGPGLNPVPPISAPPAAPPAQSQAEPNMSSGSWNRGPGAPVTKDTKQAQATGVWSYGPTDVNIPAGMSVFVEAYQIKLPQDRQPRTGPGFACLVGPFSGNVWIHDGQIWQPVPSDQLAGLMSSVEQGWLAGPKHLTPAFKVGC